MNQHAMLVVRPSPSNRAGSPALRSVLGNPFTVIGLVVVVLISIRSAATSRGLFLWVLAFGAILFAGIGGHYLLYLSNVTLYVKDGKLGSTNFLRNRIEMLVDDALTLQLCSVTYNSGGNVQPYLIALGKNGRSAFTIPSADHFSLNDIRRVAAIAFITVTGSWREQIPLSELDRRFPGALSPLWRLLLGDWRHPRVVSTALVLTFVSLIVLVVVFTVLKSQGLL